MIKKCTALLFLSVLVITGCASEKDEMSSESTNKEPLFSEQKRALDKANEVEHMLQTGADSRQQQIDEQTR